MGTAVLEPPPEVGAPRAGVPSCPANVRETHIAFGYKPQADLQTINTTAELWSLTKTNPALATVTPNTEDDSQDIGKGDEFPTQVFPTSMDVAIPVEKYVSSEFLAWQFCFATGKATKTAAGLGWTYAAVPSDPVVNCINLPAFSYVEQIRPQPDSVVDRAAIGCVVNDFTITMESGPGRTNCRIVSNWVGTGKIQSPSGVIVPPVTAEHFLNAASATINIAGIDYIAQQSFISLEFHWNNNVRVASGIFPGSGVDANGFAIRGRMEYGNREITLNFVARAAKGSQEFQNLVSQTPGALTVTLTGAMINGGPNTHGMRITAPKTVLNSVVNGEADGIVTVNCGVRFLKPATGDIIVMEATTGQDGILGL